MIFSHIFSYLKDVFQLHVDFEVLNQRYEILCVYCGSAEDHGMGTDLVTSDHMVIKDLLTNLQALLIPAKTFIHVL